MSRKQAPPSRCCPRCGYDLRGVIETWSDCCPLHGTCSECGLQLGWVQIMRPDLTTPTWCVEHRGGRFGLPVGGMLTLLRTAIPWSFWRRLQMHHAISPGRLAMYVLTLLVLTAVLFAAHQTTIAIVVRWRMGQFIAVERQKYMNYQIRERIARVPGMTLADIPSDVISECQMIAARDCAVKWSYPHAIVEALARPFSEQSNGRFILWGISDPYPAPTELYDAVTANFGFQGSFRPRSWFGRFAVPTRFATDWQLAWFLAIPAGFVLLPVSRRNARVRWAHVWRISIYSLGIPVGLLCLVLIGSMVSYAIPTIHDTIHWMTERLYYLALVPFTTLWWWMAIRRYLQMPHGLSIVLLFGFIACFAYFVFRLTFDLEGLYREFDEFGLL